MCSFVDRLLFRVDCIVDMTLPLPLLIRGRNPPENGLLDPTKPEVAAEVSTLRVDEDGLIAGKLNTAEKRSFRSDFPYAFQNWVICCILALAKGIVSGCMSIDTNEVFK